MASSDVAIQGIIFHADGSFDISYAEQRDIGPSVVVIRQAMVLPGVVDDQVDSIRDDLKELLDLVLEKQHEAPSRISRR